MMRRYSKLSEFLGDDSGFTAAETALLALVLCSMCIMVANIVVPAAIQAAKALNRELAGN